MARSTIYDFEDLKEKPRMPTAELEEMLIGVIRSPDLWETFGEYTAYSDWDKEHERHYKHLLDGFGAIVNSERYPIGAIPYGHVVAEARHRLNADYRLKNSGLIDEILGQPTDPNPIAGLLYLAYKTVDASRLDAQRRIALAKKFLIERQVHDVKLRLIKDAADAVAREDGDGALDLYTNSCLANLEKRRAKIEALGRAAGHAQGQQVAIRRLACGRSGPGADRPQDRPGQPRPSPRRLAGLDRGGRGARSRQDGAAVAGRLRRRGKPRLQRRVRRRHFARDADEHAPGPDQVPSGRHGLVRSAARLARSPPRAPAPGRSTPRPAGARYYTRDDNTKLDAVEAKLNGDFGDRISVYGKDDLPGVIDADVLVSLLAEAKARAGATRGLLVLDFLQFLAAPEAIQKRGEVECDNWRAQVLKDVVARTTSADNPEGDVVLVASEASKPANSKDDWAVELRDVKGSGRTVSLADTCLHIRNMSGREVQKTYGLASADKDVVAKQLDKLDKGGIWPAMFVLTKSRDGTRRSAWPMELLHRRSTWRRPPKPPVMQRNGVERDVDRNGDDKLEAARDRLLKVMEPFARGETETVLAKAAGIGKKQIKAILKQLIADGLVEMVTIVKPHGAGERRHKGYRLVAANGQPAGSPSNNGSTGNGRH